MSSGPFPGPPPWVPPAAPRPPRPVPVLVATGLGVAAALPFLFRAVQLLARGGGGELGAAASALGTFVLVVTLAYVVAVVRAAFGSSGARLLADVLTTMFVLAVGTVAGVVLLGVEVTGVPLDLDAFVVLQVLGPLALAVTAAVLLHLPESSRFFAAPRR